MRRALPSRERRTVGPFVFCDQMGPGEFLTGKGLDVRPHPHIGLAAITYLFAGEILHRDTLGSLSPIRPGDVNGMTAGRGIAHAERTDPVLRSHANALFGIQLWGALPQAQEETAPVFVHYPGSTLPTFDDGGALVRVIAGEAWGTRSPVDTRSPLFYADAALAAGATLPLPDEHEERAAYVLDGVVEIGGDRLALRAVDSAARVLLLGGATLDGPRHLFWNFLSSRQGRIEQAKEDWKSGAFGKVPGDEAEFIPLPDAMRVPANH